MKHPVPLCGRMSYCYSKCLKMVLDWEGDQYPLPFLECLTRSLLALSMLLWPRRKAALPSTASTLM